MEETFRLAGEATYTTDPELYCKSWKDYGDCGMAFFPGYVAAAYDPGIRLEKRRFYKDNDGRKVYRVEARIDLSTQAVDLLVKMALEK